MLSVRCINLWALLLVGVLSAPSAAQASDTTCAILHTSQDHSAGEVCVSLAGDSGTLSFETSGGWTLDAVHVWAGDSLSQIPMAGNSGNPHLGQFPLRVSDLDGSSSFSAVFSTADLPADSCGEDVLVAAHANVRQEFVGPRGAVHYSDESAWAGESGISSGSNQARYFTFINTCSSVHEEALDPEPEPGQSPEVTESPGDDQGAENTPKLQSCAVFYAGQHMEAGSVCLSLHGDYLLLDYLLINNWQLHEAHAWAGSHPLHAPQTSQGNLRPGRFPFSDTMPATDSFTFNIPLRELAINSGTFCEDLLYVAAHGVVSKAGHGTESAWAGGELFSARGNWARYFSLTPDCTDENSEPPDLPPVCELVGFPGGAEISPWTISEPALRTLSRPEEVRGGSVVVNLASLAYGPTLSFTLENPNEHIRIANISIPTDSGIVVYDFSPALTAGSLHVDLAPFRGELPSTFTVHPELEVCSGQPEEAS